MPTEGLLAPFQHQQMAEVTCTICGDKGHVACLCGIVISLGLNPQASVYVCVYIYIYIHTFLCIYIMCIENVHLKF